MSTVLSILIVSWNSWKDLDRCLGSLANIEFDKDYEVVVVDNGSSDGTVEKVQDKYSDVRLICNSTNLGLPAAVNQGFSNCSGIYVMLLDVDTEIAPQTPATLYHFMEQHPDVAVSAPRIYTPAGDIEESARNLPSVMTGLFGRQSLLRRFFPDNPFSRRYLLPENLTQTEPFIVEQVSAACMFMRRSILISDGPWDEGYRCYWIDSDWCANLKRKGRRIFCVPGARIIHHENNQANKKKSPWRIWHFHLGAFRLYRKYYTWGRWDPRNVITGLALIFRALCQLGLNALKSDPDHVVDQTSE